MTHASLFSGIGGFDLAAEWMGWKNAFHCEINPFCQTILKYYWPHAETYTDIKTTDFNVWRGRIDILTGGFPCQPYSSAGKRKGKDDDRHLWPQMLRAIREISPCFIVGENVRGLTHWNGGMVFDEVQADLEAEGFEVLPFLLPAACVGAPHQRERIWFIAYNASYAKDIGYKCGPKSDLRYEEKFYQGEQGRHKTHGGEFVRRGMFSSNIWTKFPTQPAVCGGNDGLPAELDGIAFSKWRRESIQGYGNAIVPQVAFEIFKSINTF